MKIGILTYHRAENYGALLQAYAMKTYLQSLGHDVSFVDYWPKYHSDYFSLFSWSRFMKAPIKGKILILMNVTVWLLPRYIRKKKLQMFMYEKLGIPALPLYTDMKSITNRYDVVVYGSDQIWRKQNLGGVGFDSWYFGSENVVATKKIVYAGSMGTIDTTAEDDSYIKKMMNNFNSISVREQDLKLYLQRLDFESSLVVDPVFLLSAEQWRNVAVKSKQKGNYILFYNLLLTPESSRFAEKLSAKKNLPIVEITKTMPISRLGGKFVTTTSVPEFLGLIDGAEYVISNSFHGVAFSIIFNKQFYAIGMRNKANRVISLLRSLGMESRYIKDDRLDDISISLIQKEGDGILNSLVRDSINYLNIVIGS
jgi:Polysaccharide pyruvyl transferase.